MAGPSQPLISSPQITGGNLIFSVTGGPDNGSFSVLTATNLTTPLTNWVVLTTTNFDNTGSFTVTNPITHGVPAQFYLIKSSQ